MVKKCIFYHGELCTVVQLRLQLQLQPQLQHYNFDNFSNFNNINNTTTITTTTTRTTALQHATSRSCEWGDRCNHCNHSKKHNSNHLSVHQWIRSAIRESQQPTLPIGFLFLKLPPPPCAVLVYIYMYDIYIYIYRYLYHIYSYVYIFITYMYIYMIYVWVVSYLFSYIYIYIIYLYTNYMISLKTVYESYIRVLPPQGASLALSLWCSSPWPKPQQPPTLQENFYRQRQRVCIALFIARSSSFMALFRRFISRV